MMPNTTQPAEATGAHTVGNSRLIDTLGAATKLDLVFWATMTQSTVWAASTRPEATIISIVWLVLAIVAGCASVADRLR